MPLERRPFWSEDVESALVEANAFISSLQAPNIFVFDAYSILVGKDGKIRPQYSRDLLHLNQEGYRVLNRELEQFFANLSVDRYSTSSYEHLFNKALCAKQNSLKAAACST